MYFSYPKEYFFPVLIKNTEDFNINGEILHDFDLLRRYDENISFNNIFDDIDEEFVENLGIRII
ncbi:hypothetical protein [Clostridium fallax]|uniref:Uncharacterized protein n=1 Tax=Clostridium fallax TaxID=1533 RepID=A0A1M4SSH0_9CLOT|nr:hypothetical protein [Clostridium fallax]SHE35203.1 hypothetical protein SAMN05443638_101154 [Clostridium fallax]SQB07951.1 Uncharacterised protein [Clostridium fallax]